MSRCLLNDNNIRKIIGFIPKADKLVLDDNIREYISLVVRAVDAGDTRNDILKLGIKLYYKNNMSLVIGLIEKVLCSKTALYETCGVISGSSGITLATGHLMITPSIVYDCYVAGGRARVKSTNVSVLTQFAKTEGKNRWTKTASIEFGPGSFCHLFILGKYNLGYDISKWPAAALRAYWEATTSGIPINRDLVRIKPLRGGNQFRLAYRELVKMSDDFRRININPSTQMKKIQNNRMKSLGIGKANVGLVDEHGDEAPF